MTTKQTVLDIEGMHCHSCSMLIDETVEDLPGVVRSQTSRAANSATIEFDSETVDEAALVAAIAGIGYSAKVRP